MSSSTPGQTRTTRSLRKPVTRGDELSKKSGSVASGTGNAPSPSRLPQIKSMLTRSASVNTAATSTSTRTTAAAPKAHARGASSSLRPLSGVHSSSTSTTRRPSPTDAATATTTSTRSAGANAGATKAAPVTRSASVRKPVSTSSTKPSSNSSSVTSKAVSSVAARMPRPTSSSSFRSSTTQRSTRPTSSNSIRAPSSSTTAQRAAAASAHIRSKSSVTSLTTATTLRPRSIHGLSSISTTSLNSNNTPTTTLSKPVTRSQTQSSRNASQSSIQSAPSAANPIVAARPAFNTNQQHYSPLKNLGPKPLTSTFLAPPSPSKLPSNVALSAETSRLQTELLQLSLLHRNASVVGAQWHASAEQKVGARFAKLVRENEEVGQLEREGIESRNAAALLRWGSGNSHNSNNNDDARRTLGLEERLQMLDEVLGGVWSMSEPGGRYSRVVEAFEEWADHMADVVAAQRSGDVEALVNDGEVLFASELDTKGWKGECAGLVRKLEGWRRMLGELVGDGQVLEHHDNNNNNGDSSRSGLARVLDGCCSLVDDMLAELAAMDLMEREMVRAEDEWIEMMDGELRFDDNDDTPQLWKLVV